MRKIFWISCTHKLTNVLDNLPKFEQIRGDLHSVKLLFKMNACYVLRPIFNNFTMWFVNLIQIPIKVNMFFQSVWQSCIVYCKYNLAPWETKRIHMIWGWCPDQRLFQLVQGLCKLFHGHSNLCRQLKRKPNKFASNKVTDIWLSSEEIPIFHIIL